MDSLTQIVLGAGVGEALLGKKAGNRTILWGGIIATVPDLDIFPTLLMDAVDGIHFHRGFMHSILFFVIASPFFGWLIHRIYKGRFATRREWTVFSFWVLLTHALLDCFTSWGTQLFYPIDYHVALNTIFIVDPLYTVPFLALIIALLFYKKESKTRQRLCYAGLILSSAYLLLTVVNKFIVHNAFEDALAKQKIEYVRYSTKPTPLNNILWSAMVESKDGYYLGYYSLLDDNRDIEFQYIPGNRELLSEVPEDKKLKILLHITDGYYCLEKKDDRLLLHDLRFGQATEMATGKGDFVFSFYLDKKNDRLEITQKEMDFRDIKWEMFVMLWKRMMGVKEF